MQHLLVNALVHLSSLIGSVCCCCLGHVCIFADCDKMSIYAQPFEVMEHVQLAEGHSNAACQCARLGHNLISGHCSKA